MDPNRTIRGFSRSRFLIFFGPLDHFPNNSHSGTFESNDLTMESKFIQYKYKGHLLFYFLKCQVGFELEISTCVGQGRNIFYVTRLDLLNPKKVSINSTIVSNHFLIITSIFSHSNGPWVGFQIDVLHVIGSVCYQPDAFEASILFT